MKKRALAVILLLAAISVVVASHASTRPALPSDQWYVAYYMDDGNGNWQLVGESQRFCDGTYWSWGQLWGTYESVWQVSCVGPGEMHTCYYVDTMGYRTQIDCP